MTKSVPPFAGERNALATSLTPSDSVAAVPPTRGARAHRWVVTDDGTHAACVCGATKRAVLRLDARGRLQPHAVDTGPEKCPGHAPAPRAPGVCASWADDAASVRREWGGAWYLEPPLVGVDPVSMFATCGSCYHTGDTPRGVSVCRGWASFVDGCAPIVAAVVAWRGRRGVARSARQGDAPPVTHGVCVDLRTIQGVL